VVASELGSAGLFGFLRLTVVGERGVEDGRGEEAEASRDRPNESSWPFAFIRGCTMKVFGRLLSFAAAQ
jgi:hypothetical protein